MPFQSLKVRLKDLPHVNVDHIEEAFLFAEKAHRGQKRKSGEDYIFHPLEVAIYLTEYHADEATIIAALLHDTVEDTKYTLEDIEERFGKYVAQLTDGVTKFNQEELLGIESLDLRLESLRKWFDVMHQDIRVAIIKLVDRLHNMETLDGHKDDEKKRLIAKETLDVYVKIAFRLGINVLKEKLETEALKYIDPKSYDILTDIQEKEFQLAKYSLNDIRQKLNSKDVKQLIQKVVPQAPALMKMHDKEVQLKEEIKGVLPLIYIINVEREEDCYKTLYYIHNKWKVEMNGFEDYINTPDPGGYRALHTRVIYKDGRHILFKIRTNEMEKYSDYGITLYCFSGEDKDYKNLEWLNQLSLISGSTKEHSQNFWDQLQHDILEAPIVVDTARHDTLLLPANSTILDAAFYSYAKKAWMIEKIYLNGVHVPLYTTLKHNDRIHCYFKEKINIKYEWLGYVDTSLAGTYVREGLQALDEEKKVQLGEKILAKELMKDGKGYIDEIEEEKLNRYFKESKVGNIRSLYKKVAEGELSPKQIISDLYSDKTKSEGYSKPLKKHLRIKGTMESITNFIKHMPENVKNSSNYDIKGYNGNSCLNLTVNSLEEQEWGKLTTLIERTHDIYCQKPEHNLKEKKIILALLFVCLLWGLHPVFAYQLLQTTVTPPVLIIMRFISLSLVLGSLVFVQSLTKKNHSIPFFKKEMFITSLLLFGLAFCTYMALIGTIPSTHLLALRIFGLISLTSVTLRRNGDFESILLYVLIVLSGFVFLFFDSELDWPLESKLWSLGAILFFSLYSYSIGFLKEKFRIFSRYYHLQFILSTYCALFALALVPFISFPDLTISQFLSVFVFCCIFVVAPHTLYFSLLKNIRNNIVQNYLLGGAFFFGLLAEIIFLKITPSFWKVTAFIFIYLGLTLLFFLYRTNKKNEEDQI